MNNFFGMVLSFFDHFFLGTLESVQVSEVFVRPPLICDRVIEHRNINWHGFSGSANFIGQEAKGEWGWGRRRGYIWDCPVVWGGCWGWAWVRGFDLDYWVGIGFRVSSSAPVPVGHQDKGKGKAIDGT